VKERRLWFLVLLCVSSTIAVAQSHEEVFHEANRSYEAGRFDEAAAGYRSLLRYGIQDPALDYNLGNAEFRTGHIGRAILHWERARRLSPTDADIQANLAYGRTFLFDKVEPPEAPALVRWIEGVQDRVGPDAQAWAVVLFLWAIAAVVAWCFARPGGWNAGAGWSVSALSLVLVLCAASWWTTRARLASGATAVVLDEVVEVLSGPGPTHPTLFTVHEGLTVEVRAEREGWVQVSLPDGRGSGWIPSGSMERV
jgi:hypothetical protein